MNAWADQAGRLPRPGSPDGPGLTEAQFLWVMAVEYGLDARWVLDLPPNVGEEFLALCKSAVPYRTQLLEMIVERLSL